jgi:hypothetical protein
MTVDGIRLNTYQSIRARDRQIAGLFVFLPSLSRRINDASLGRPGRAVETLIVSHPPGPWRRRGSG